MDHYFSKSFFPYLIFNFPLPPNCSHKYLSCSYASTGKRKGRFGVFLVTIPAVQPGSLASNLEEGAWGGTGCYCLIAPWFCKVKQNVYFLVFPYLLYNSGGWDNAGGVKVESTRGIPTFHPSKAPGRSRSFLGKSPVSSLSNGLKK